MTTLNTSALNAISFNKVSDLGRVHGFECSVKGIRMSLVLNSVLTRYTNAILIRVISGRLIKATIDLNEKDSPFEGVSRSDREALSALYTQLKDMANNGVINYNKALQSFPVSLEG